MLRNPDSSRFFSQTALNESEKIGFDKGIGLARIALARVENGIGGSTAVKEMHTLKAIASFEKTKNEEALGHCYNDLGYIYKGQGKNQLAIEYLKKGISLAEKTGATPQEITIMYDGLSLFYQDLGNYKESFEYRKKSFDLNEKINDNWGIMLCLLSFGDLFTQAGDIETANEYYQKVIDYFHSNSFKGNPPYKVVSKAFFNLSNNDSAISYLDKALLHNQSRDFDASVKENYKRYVQIAKAEVYIRQHQYEKAVEYLIEPLKYFAENKDKKRVSVSSMFSMGQAQFGLKNYPDALRYAKEAFGIAKEFNLRKDIKDASKLLWKTYDQLNKTDSAYYFLQQFLIAKEDLENNRSFNELAFFKATQEDEEKQARIELLSKDNKIKEQDLIIQRQNFRRENLSKKFLIAGLLGLFVLGVIVFRSILLKRKLESEKRVLAEKELQLQKLENERRVADMEMIALRSQMNPHFIFNCLNSINRFVLRNDTEAASGYLTKFSKLMRMVLENSKQPLIPLEEEVKCLELYIQMEQFRCKNAFTYYIKYHDGVNTEEAMIPPLLLQPFVENAIWHGVNPKEGDGKIGIEFFQKEEALYCVIRDNGIGRKKASELRSQLSENHKSMGLQITKERLAIMEEHQSKESPVEIEDMYDENGKAAGTKVTIRIFSLPAFEELKSSLNL
jgi:tetratricopeptide (TPR) repeat protein